MRRNYDIGNGERKESRVRDIAAFMWNDDT